MQRQTPWSTIPCFPAMKDAQDHQSVSQQTILNDVGRVEHAHDDLAAIPMGGQRASEFRPLDQQVHLSRDLSPDNLRHCREAALQKTSETIEIGDCVSRPFDVHRLDQGLKSGVPQV